VLTGASSVYLAALDARQNVFYIEAAAPLRADVADLLRFDGLRSLSAGDMSSWRK
jgi:hypothetical protein